MRNFIQPGNTVTVPAPSNVTSGQGVLVGDLFGVASGDAANGESLDLAVSGVFQLPKKSGDTINVGQAVSWDAGAVTDTPTEAGVAIGHAVEAAGNGVTSIAVRLAPIVAA